MTKYYKAQCQIVCEDSTGLEKVFWTMVSVESESELTPKEILNRLTHLKESVDKGKYKSVTLVSLGDSPFRDLLSNPPHYP